MRRYPDLLDQAVPGIDRDGQLPFLDLSPPLKAQPPVQLSRVDRFTGLETQEWNDDSRANLTKWLKAKRDRDWPFRISVSQHIACRFIQKRAIYPSDRIVEADTQSILARGEERVVDNAHPPVALRLAVWVNPEDRPYWEGSMTCRVVQRLFPMFHLSVDGVAEAVTALIGARQ